MGLSIDLPNRNIHLKGFKVSGNIFSHSCRLPVFSKILDKLNLSWSVVRYLLKSSSCLGTTLWRSCLTFSTGLWVLSGCFNWLLALDLDESPIFEETCINSLRFYLLSLLICRRRSKLEPINLDFEVVSTLVLTV